MSANRIRHVNVMVDDLAGAVAFHTGVLGLGLAPTRDLGFPAQFIAVDELQEIHLNQLVEVACDADQPVGDDVLADRAFRPA